MKIFASLHRNFFVCATNYEVMKFYGLNLIPCFPLEDSLFNTLLQGLFKESSAGILFNLQIFCF